MKFSPERTHISHPGEMFIFPANLLKGGQPDRSKKDGNFPVARFFNFKKPSTSHLIKFIHCQLPMTSFFTCTQCARTGPGCSFGYFHFRVFLSNLWAFMDGFHCHLQEISLKFSIFPNLLGSPMVSEPFFGAMSGG